MSAAQKKCDKKQVKYAKKVHKNLYTRVHKCIMDPPLKDRYTLALGFGMLTKLPKKNFVHDFSLSSFKLKRGIPPISSKYFL